MPQPPLLSRAVFDRADAIRDDAERMAAALRAGIAAESPVDPEDLFAHVYAPPTPQLREQRAQLRAELEVTP